MARNEFDKTNELKRNVLDEVTYTKRQVTGAWVKLIVGLWGFFFVMLVILFLITRNMI
ncbi:MAG: hypothetical protein LUC24_05490 [Bacteroidales bacterium]|nr:hypothetical protein [Bacteroidales bacterium]